MTSTQFSNTPSVLFSLCVGPGSTPPWNSVYHLKCKSSVKYLISPKCKRLSRDTRVAPVARPMLFVELLAAGECPGHGVCSELCSVFLSSV